MHKQHKDLLIVGQGIAGSMLAWHADIAGLTFDILDECSQQSASAVSSGIINPITGPKYVKSWMIAELLPHARNTYQSIGDQFNQRLVREIPIWRHIPTVKAENLWDSRMLDRDYDGYLSKPKTLDPTDLIPGNHQFGIVTKGLIVDVQNLLSTLRTHWTNRGVLRAEKFDEDLLNFDRDIFNYKDRSYRHIILAMGHRGIQSKWFASDEYTPVKGEVLICRIDNWPTDKIIKYGKFIVPLSKDIFWVGSNYQHQFQNEHPDPGQIQDLKNFLEQNLGINYRIMNHIAGIRPSTRFRRPFIGMHPLVKNLYLFNGLGTKGISLAPYFSHTLIQSIKEGRTFRNTEAFDKAFVNQPGR